MIRLAFARSRSWANNLLESGEHREQEAASFHRASRKAFGWLSNLWVDSYIHFWGRNGKAILNCTK